MNPREQAAASAAGAILADGLQAGDEIRGIWPDEVFDATEYALRQHGLRLTISMRNRRTYWLCITAMTQELGQ
jgi:hypothetical protein